MPSAEGSLPLSVAVAVPAYNEDGIGGFLRELDKHLAESAGAVTFFVVDDASSSAMPAELAELVDDFEGRLVVLRNSTNSGHGPTLRRAYGAAVSSGADLVFQVDGDGQFEGEDVQLLVDAVARGADVAVGTRRDRVDPWFRRGLSLALRVYLRVGFGVSSTDPNVPFRLFRREILADLLAVVPDDALVPNVYLTVLAGRRRLQVVEVPVRHRVRRGETAEGTMWGARKRPLLVPRRLITFVRKALAESLRMSPTLRRQP